MQRQHAVVGLLSAAALGLLSGCSPEVVIGTDLPESIRSSVFVSAEPTRYDILLVTDRSGSMATKQEKLARNYRQLISQLTAADGRPLDYRIAVATSDVGAGGFNVDASSFALCAGEGDAGLLQTAAR